MTNHNPVFNQQQLDYMKDQQFLLAKVEIGRKVENLLGAVEKNLYSIVPDYQWPSGILVKSGKISKGENYRGLPYYMLDYPRKFEKEDVFAFRTMFWWGNYFSSTLHLSGSHLGKYRSELISSLDEILASKTHICINDTAWEYHFGKDNYRPVEQFTPQKLGILFSNMPFVKISFRWELETYPDLPQLVSQSFRQTMSWILDNNE